MLSEVSALFNSPWSEDQLLVHPHTPDIFEVHTNITIHLFMHHSLVLHPLYKDVKTDGRALLVICKTVAGYPLYH